MVRRQALESMSVPYRSTAGVTLSWSRDIAMRVLEWIVPELERAPNRFVRATVVLLSVQFLLPNLLFIGWGAYRAIVRPPWNLDYALIALAFPWLGAAGAAVATAIVALLDVIVAMTYHFHGNPGALFRVVHDLPNLPAADVATVATGLLTACVIVGAMIQRSLRRVPRRLGPNLVAAACCYLLASASNSVGDAARGGPSRPVVLEDFLLNAVVPYVALVTEYRGIEKDVVPSATGDLLAALRSGGDLPDRIVLVVVESLGKYTDSDLNDLQWRAFDAGALRRSHRVQIGSIPQAGSTVKGEIRELCGALSASVRPDPALLPVDNCLPQLLRRRGYRAIALHGFRREMFDRSTWYPALGFDEVYFDTEIAAALGSDRRCGARFSGSCDEDVWSLVADRLQTADQPLFIYWLTLNAHPPVSAADVEASDLDCASSPIAEEHDELCTLLRLHDVVLGQIVSTALSNDFLSTAFIIVGDHPPSLFGASAQRFVVPDSVPYAILWPRATMSAQLADEYSHD